jgi:uncharacterized protein YqjF (DUF2071 family)
MEIAEPFGRFAHHRLKLVPHRFFFANGFNSETIRTSITMHGSCADCQKEKTRRGKLVLEKVCGQCFGIREIGAAKIVRNQIHMAIEKSKLFLSAEWRWIVILNFEIDPARLAHRVPAGTELDSWNGKHFVSLVGFLFQNTRVWKIGFPFHRNFEEVNLRFYVRRKAGDGWRRGVVFIKEIVPRAAIAFVARVFYNENYVSLPMSHRIETGGQISATYSWFSAGRKYGLRVTVHGSPVELVPNSEAEFITEHYWGYTRQRNNRTLEYHVEHPPWRVWNADEAQFSCDVRALYGEEFEESLNQKPASAFLAEGSMVNVLCGNLCR